MKNNDLFDLERFVKAQRGVYEQACAELRGGRKTGHWMWFVFPQIAGLGMSAMSQRYAIGSLDEAQAYLRHSILGSRLREVFGIVNEIEGRTVEEIFGWPDDMKLRSSATLFAHATEENAEFVELIRKYFGGEWDAKTVGLMGKKIL